MDPNSLCSLSHNKHIDPNNPSGETESGNDDQATEFTSDKPKVEKVKLATFNFEEFIKLEERVVDGANVELLGVLSMPTRAYMDLEKMNPSPVIPRGLEHNAFTQEEETLGHSIDSCLLSKPAMKAPVKVYVQAIKSIALVWNVWRMDKRDHQDVVSYLLLEYRVKFCGLVETRVAKKQSMLKQRAKMQLLKDGDACTKDREVKEVIFDISDDKALGPDADRTQETFQPPDFSISPSLHHFKAVLESKSCQERQALWPSAAVTEDRDVSSTEKTGDQDGEKASVSRKMEGLKNSVFGATSSDSLLNAAIVLGAGSLAITKLLTIDHDYWHGWTLYEVLRYAPEHNWNAYEEALKTHPVLAKLMISGIVYSLGDWIAQCYEGKPLFEFDRTRMFRLFLQRMGCPFSSLDLEQQFYYLWLLDEAGWKLWPFAHLITYGVIPVEQRLLWVDCVELIWVTILSTYSNEKSEMRISEASEAEAGPSSNEVKSDRNQGHIWTE
ncbi:UNVERIFIED_CONTAM: hypothetical protein Scaly_2246400 [Sesamum calycinum]|uniref:Uncharacterized protein n=1 Tax=Sesamum calycinum TaxID=2727403 RepID=A0AAW2MAM4_9LAMI